MKSTSSPEPFPPSNPPDPSDPASLALTLQQLFIPARNTPLLHAIGGIPVISKTFNIDLDKGITHDQIQSLQKLGSSPLSLGSNVLPHKPPKSFFSFVKDCFNDKIMILLSAVGLLSLAIGLYQDFTATGKSEKIHWIEGFTVLVAILIIVLVTSINDFQKDRMFRNLNDKKEDRKIKAIRDSNTTLISIHHILIGDILLLEPGDVVPADGVLLQSANLRVDESSSTGEQDAVKMGGTGEILVMSGSKVLEGNGKYLVTGIGVGSFFGSIMMGLRVESQLTPLQKRLNTLADQISKLGTGIALLLFVLLLLKYIIVVATGVTFGSLSGTEVATNIVKILLLSITVVAVAVPEGLPLAVTLSLAFATRKMLQDNNLVRVLSACETMGSATTICSDKTGTLTQNKMTVVAGVIGKNVAFDGEDEITGLSERASKLPKGLCDPKTPLSGIADQKQAAHDATTLLSRLAQGVAINSTAFDGIDEETGLPTLIGSKTEKALLDWIKKLGYDYATIRNDPNIQVVHVFPFSSERKIMATIVKDCTTNPPIYRLHVKGASEIVLKRSDRVVLLPFSPSLNPGSFESPRLSGESGSSTNRKSMGGIPAPGSRSNPTTPMLYPVDTKLKTDLVEIIEKYATQALRTIALSYKEFTSEEYEAFVSSIRDKISASNNEATLERKDSGILRRNSTNEEPKPASPPTFSTSFLNIPGQAQRSGSHSDIKSFVDSVNEMDAEEVLNHPIAFDHLSDLIIASIVGIQDPLRPGVVDSVQQCKNAGVMVRMVTGDNVHTAKSIAQKCGIYSHGGLCVEGSYFRSLNDQEKVEILPKLQVLARSSPIDKQELVRILQSVGEVVAVTGDGTNDGPALKLANIGFSMGIAGTEVAKEASSIILMDDSFSSVVKAILWGRCVNDSIKKFLQFQLAVNISAGIFSLADSSEESVLTVVQLLWVNLVMDTLAALALATEKPNMELLNRPPQATDAPLISVPMWKMIFGQALIQFGVNAALLFAGPALFGFTELRNIGGILSKVDEKNPNYFAIEDQIKTLRTFIFNTYIIQLGNNFNSFRGILNNPPFMLIFGIILVFQIILVQFGGQAFQTYGLKIEYWAFCVLIGTLSIPMGIVVRAIPDELFQRKQKPKDIEMSQRPMANVPLV